MNFTQIGQMVFYAFCLVTLIQLFYYLFFFIRLAVYKPKKKAVSQTHPVSVIICARDEAANLAKNLPGALVQQYSTTHEVIVVDDNSFDDTRYLLEEYRKTYRQLQVVELKQEAKLIPGKKFPLSIGIKTAKHEIVLLTDAGLINKIVRWETFHTALQYLSYALAGQPYMGVGRNLSYKKTIFFRHKGFSAHNNIASGDDDLFINMAATKKNTKINIDKAAFTLSEPPKTWGTWIRQKNRHYSTGKFYKPIHKFLLGLYTFSHMLFYPLLAASLLFYNWQLALIVFGIRFLIQAVILYPCMKKLNEQAMYPWFLFIDIWMFFYYLIFAVAVFKRPGKAWK
jgi:glycosyltransferase involved in cell wall biosynthesis